VHALDAAHVTAGAHLLAPEARRVRDVADRESLDRDGLVAMKRDELRLGRRDEPDVVIVVAVEVLVEVRQVGGSQQRLPRRDRRRVDLREAET